MGITLSDEEMDAINITRAELLMSFGRRRRTKVVDERTRGEQALVYGELNIYPMRERVRPPPHLVWCKGSLRHCCTRHRLVVVEWQSKATIGSQLMTSCTS